jgi:hypothetical protein
MRPRFGRLSIAAYLGLGIGGLMFVAVASILAITLYANWRNTTELRRTLLGRTNTPEELKYLAQHDHHYGQRAEAPDRVAPPDQDRRDPGAAEALGRV